MSIWELDRKPRILIVEHDAEFARHVADFWRRRGADVDIARTGSAALSKCSSTRYDLLSLDAGLPDIGDWVLKRLLKGLGESVPVILLVARGEETDLVRSLKLASDDYLTIPFNLEDHHLRVKHLLKRRAEYLRSIDAPVTRPSKQVGILFLAANPRDSNPLRLDEEFREIDRVVLQAKYRDCFELRQQWAVRVEDIQGHLLRFRPNIVHFSGHGTRGSEVVLEDNSGNPRAVKPKALSKLFSILKGEVSGVVLSACFSEKQAQAINEHAGFVVGMSGAIGDQSAIAFSRAFYQAIAYGEDVQSAFELGCNQIDLESLSDKEVPKLLVADEQQRKRRFV